MRANSQISRQASTRNSGGSAPAMPISDHTGVVAKAVAICAATPRKDSSSKGTDQRFASTRPTEPTTPLATAMPKNTCASCGIAAWICCCAAGNAATASGVSVISCQNMKRPTRFHNKASTATTLDQSGRIVIATPPVGLACSLRRLRVGRTRHPATHGLPVALVRRVHHDGGRRRGG